MHMHIHESEQAVHALSNLAEEGASHTALASGALGALVELAGGVDEEAAKATTLTPNPGWDPVYPACNPTHPACNPMHIQGGHPHAEPARGRRQRRGVRGARELRGHGGLAGGAAGRHQAGAGGSTEQPEGAQRVA